VRKIDDASSLRAASGGRINGSFYALLSLGGRDLGMLNIINSAQWRVYMMGAFCAYFCSA